MSIVPGTADPGALQQDYSAEPTATCQFSDGSSAPCDLPTGKVSWQVLGGDAGGNIMYPSAALSDCASSVGASQPTSTCQLNWNTYGDHWIEATYTSSPSAQLEGQINIGQYLAVKIQAPTDFGYAYSFDTYQNTGPSAIGDCSMAAAADWVEATFGTAPPSAGVVADYWAAEQQFSGGADVGLTASQLFSFWQSNSIGGETLTGETAVPLNQVPTMAATYVLYATATLPANYPLGDGQGGNHAWVVVGESGSGPMVVSWGQEFQLTWAEFDAWTTGVWALSAS